MLGGGFGQETDLLLGGWEAPQMLKTLRHREDLPELLNAMHLVGEGALWLGLASATYGVGFLIP